MGFVTALTSFGKNIGKEFYVSEGYSPFLTMLSNNTLNPATVLLNTAPDARDLRVKLKSTEIPTAKDKVSFLKSIYIRQTQYFDSNGNQEFISKWNVVPWVQTAFSIVRVLSVELADLFFNPDLESAYSKHKTKIGGIKYVNYIGRGVATVLVNLTLLPAISYLGASLYAAIFKKSKPKPTAMEWLSNKPCKVVAGIFKLPAVLFTSLVNTGLSILSYGYRFTVHELGGALLNGIYDSARGLWNSLRNPFSKSSEKSSSKVQSQTQSIQQNEVEQASLSSQTTQPSASAKVAATPSNTSSKGSDLQTRVRPPPPGIPRDTKNTVSTIKQTKPGTTASSTVATSDSKKPSVPRRPPPKRPEPVNVASATTITPSNLSGDTPADTTSIMSQPMEHKLNTNRVQSSTVETPDPKITKTKPRQPLDPRLSTKPAESSTSQTTVSSSSVTPSLSPSQPKDVKSTPNVASSPVIIKDRSPAALAKNAVFNSYLSDESKPFFRVCIDEDTAFTDSLLFMKERGEFTEHFNAARSRVSKIDTLVKNFITQKDQSTFSEDEIKALSASLEDDLERRFLEKRLRDFNLPDGRKKLERELDLQKKAIEFVIKHYSTSPDTTIKASQSVDGYYEKGREEERAFIDEQVADATTRFKNLDSQAKDFIKKLPLQITKPEIEEQLLREPGYTKLTPADQDFFKKRVEAHSSMLNRVGLVKALYGIRVNEYQLKKVKEISKEHRSYNLSFSILTIIEKIIKLKDALKDKSKVVTAPIKLSRRMGTNDIIYDINGFKRVLKNPELIEKFTKAEANVIKLKELLDEATKKSETPTNNYNRVNTLIKKTEDQIKVLKTEKKRLEAVSRGLQAKNADQGENEKEIKDITDKIAAANESLIATQKDFNETILPNYEKAKGAMVKLKKEFNQANEELITLFTIDPKDANYGTIAQEEIDANTKEIFSQLMELQKIDESLYKEVFSFVEIIKEKYSLEINHSYEPLKELIKNVLGKFEGDKLEKDKYLRAQKTFDTLTRELEQDPTLTNLERSTRLMIRMKPYFDRKMQTGPTSSETISSSPALMQFAKDYSIPTRPSLPLQARPEKVTSSPKIAPLPALHSRPHLSEIQPNLGNQRNVHVHESHSTSVSSGGSQSIARSNNFKGNLARIRLLEEYDKDEDTTDQRTSENNHTLDNK